MDVPGRRVVAQCNYVDSFQTHDTKRLGPAAIVADAQPDLHAHRSPNLEAFVADVEKFLLQMLKRRIGFVLCMARQVNLAIATDDASGSVHEDRCVEAFSGIA